MLVVLIIIYIAVPIAIMKDYIIFAKTIPVISEEDMAVESPMMTAGRVLFGFVTYMVFWVLNRNYVKEIADIASSDGFMLRPDPKFLYDERVAAEKNSTTPNKA